MIVTGGETNGTARMIKVMNLHIHSVVTGLLSYHVLQLLKKAEVRYVCRHTTVVAYDSMMAGRRFA